MIDTAKLRTDAEFARRVAERAAERATDGGSCNLDSTFLPLSKGERSEPVVAALTSAGLGAYPTRWLGRGVMVSPPGPGQAGKRYASNEALIRSLKNAGWPVLGYYQAD